MPLPRSPVWHPVTPLLRRRLPMDVRDWVLWDGSLTAGVRGRCPSGFALRLLRQRWCLPHHDEARVLGMVSGRRALLREVALCCGDEPLIMARTVIPAASLRGRQRRLAGLGRKPLGEVLFRDHSVRRGDFAVGYMTLAQAGVAAGRWRDIAVHARRALFRIGGAPLLVSEFFLPGLWR